MVRAAQHRATLRHALAIAPCEHCKRGACSACTCLQYDSRRHQELQALKAFKPTAASLKALQLYLRQVVAVLAERSTPEMTCTTWPFQTGKPARKGVVEIGWACPGV